MEEEKFISRARLMNRADVVSAEAQQATYQALMEFVRTEWIDGPCENDQACKLNLTERRAKS